MRGRVLPQTGRRVSVTKLGASPLETIDTALTINSEAPPVSALLPGDVMIHVRSAAVGWVDLLMASGQYQHVPEPPYTPGLEFAGEIAAVGAAVTNVKIGDAVIADGLNTGPRSLGEHRRYGGWATYAIAPATAVFEKPSALSFDEAACLLGGAETAYHALVTRAAVQAGETVLVLGATGSTGLAAVALAKHLGATVIAVGRTAGKLAVTRSYGADHIVATTDDLLRDQVKALTGGRGADVIYDAVGGSMSTDALRAAAFGARFVVVGWASTPFAARGAESPNTLPTNLILMKSIDVLGSPAAIAVHRDPTLRPVRLAAIFAAANPLRPHVGATFELAAIAEALHAKWRGSHAGNIVVRP